MSIQCRTLLALAGLLAIGAAAVAQDGAGTAPRPNDPGRDGAPAAERRPDVMGRIATVSPDGRTITVNAPPRPTAEGQPPPRDARPEPVQVTVTDKTRLLFFGVGDGEAKLTPGLMAMVWLDEGSKDQAGRIRLMK